MRAATFGSTDPCYQKYGFQYESLHSLNKEGVAGAEAILEIMHSYRNNPPRELGGNKVVKIYDYQIGVERDLNNNSEIPLLLPKANVLIFVTSEGSRIALRPSGTSLK